MDVVHSDLCRVSCMRLVLKGSCTETRDPDGMVALIFGSHPVALLCVLYFSPGAVFPCFLLHLHHSISLLLSLTLREASRIYFLPSFLPNLVREFLFCAMQFSQY